MRCSLCRATSLNVNSWLRLSDIHISEYHEHENRSPAESHCKTMNNARLSDMMLCTCMVDLRQHLSHLDLHIY